MSVAQTIQHKITINELERYARKCLAYLQSPHWNLNLGPSEYEAVAITT